MTYKESTDYLFSRLPMFSRIGAAAYKPGLERVEALDEFFGHPHKEYKTIHVAGTNGKGSVSHLIASVLQEASFKTGLYTSPHLIDFRERIKVNGEMIPEDAVVDFVESFRRNPAPGEPSFFELTMCMAFDWFARAGVDVAVIEVGMGGRLDSTNIITPVESIITNISFDHTQFLGNTLEAIAGEKAGIIKHAVPVTIGERENETESVFMSKANQEFAPLTFASDNNYGLRLEHDRRGYWTVTFPSGAVANVPLGGDYQEHNILTAYEALRRLPGFEFTDEQIARGFERVLDNTGLMGRWMFLSQSPLSVCDTGHNQAGLTHNMRQLGRYLEENPGARLHIVAGFVADKDVDHILPMFPTNATYYLTQAAIPRALPVEKLVEKASALGIESKGYQKVADAYREAMAAAGKDDLVFVGGSTFVVADLLADHRKDAKRCVD